MNDVSPVTPLDASFGAAPVGTTPTPTNVSIATTQRMLAFRAAYEETAADRASLPSHTLVPINLDVQVVTTTIFGVLPRLELLRQSTLSTIPSFDVVPFDRIEVYAKALAYAQTVYLATSAPAVTLPQLLEHATRLRSMLLSDATALARRDLVDGKPLQDLRGGHGYLNVASDLGVLVRMLRERWANVDTKSALRPHELDEAEQVYERLTLAYAEREVHPTFAPSPSEDRQRAFTLVKNAYDQIRRVAMFLRWDAGDAEHFAPSLWRGRGGRAETRHPATEDEDEDEDETVPGERTPPQ